MLMKILFGNPVVSAKSLHHQMDNSNCGRLPVVPGCFAAQGRVMLGIS